MPVRVTSVNLTGKAYRRKRKRVKVQKESTIEAAALVRLEAIGFYQCWKQNGMGRASRPDRLLLGPRGIHAFIEFKRVGEEATKAQADELDNLEQRGHLVAVCDSVRSAECFGLALFEMFGPDGPQREWLRLGWRKRWQLEHC